MLAFFGGRRGFFVEAGANHPVVSSQTWLLEQQGWRGVLIEPNPELAALCRAQRPSSQVFACALVAPGGPPEVRMRIPASGLSGTELAEICADHADAAPGGFFMCPARTLNSVLEEAAPAKIDYLSIDLEGYEVPALRGFDWRRWQPTLLSIEDHCESLATYRVVTANGYRFIRRIGDNDWFVPADSPLRPSTAERVRMVRKKFLSLPFRKLRQFVRSLRRRP